MPLPAKQRPCCAPNRVRKHLFCQGVLHAEGPSCKDAVKGNAQIQVALAEEGLQRLEVLLETVHFDVQQHLGRETPSEVKVGEGESLRNSLL